MRSLQQSLQDHELTTLRVLGEWWELDLTGADQAACVSALAETLAALDMEQELLYLPPEEAEAVNDLIAHNGRMPAASFSRAHGDVRMMGPGKLEREEPWFNPVSSAEALWYRGFLYRGFDDSTDGLMEFYFLPDELTAQLTREQPVKPAVQPIVEPPAKKPLTLKDLPPSVFGGALPPAPPEPIEEVLVLSDPEPEEKPEAVSVSPSIPQSAMQPAMQPTLQPIAPPKETQTAVTDAVDDLTSILCQAQMSELRGDQAWDRLLLNADADRLALLLQLAREAGFLRRIDEGGYQLTRTAVGWLRGDREEQLRALMDGWSASLWNELRRLDALRCEGDSWENDPILPRTALLNALPRSGDWFNLDELTAHLKALDPDFQRPDGNYDTWYIRDVETGQYLTGFDSWERVEGRVLRFLVQRPMFWLGMADLGGDGAYRLTPRALDWLADTPSASDATREPLILQGNGRLLVPHNAGRYQRFQAARIAKAERVERGKPFPYLLTPASLASAKAQGIDAQRALRYLQEATQRPIPAGVKRAMERWAERGVEGRLESIIVLRVRDAEILTTLRNNPKTRDYLGESLGDLAAVVKGRDWQKLQAATTQLGLLLDYVDSETGMGD